MHLRKRGVLNVQLFTIITIKRSVLFAMELGNKYYLQLRQHILLSKIEIKV